jgi:hypothetical protein
MLMCICTFGQKMKGGIADNVWLDVKTRMVKILKSACTDLNPEIPTLLSSDVNHCRGGK